MTGLLRTWVNCLLHVFQKKTQKTPKRELELGYQRMREVQHGKLKL
ncbi:type II toxin-antitoxin system RelE/ParE family toxin [Endozoicomonas sp. ALE010]